MKSFDNSFLPKTICQWKSLARNGMEAPSLNTFSSHLDGVKQTVQKLYLIRNCRMVIMHARLCIAPAYRIISTHILMFLIIQHANVDCKEKTTNFLLECPLFNNKRVKMTNKLADMVFYPTARNLLCGTTGHSEQLNTDEFKIIQTFISVMVGSNGIT